MAGILEYIRLTHEDMEDIEQAAADCLKAKSRRDLNVSVDFCVDFLSKELEKKAIELAQFYDETDTVRNDSIRALVGDGPDDVWNIYYKRIAGVKEYHKHDGGQILVCYFPVFIV